MQFSNDPIKVFYIIFGNVYPKWILKHKLTLKQNWIFFMGNFKLIEFSEQTVFLAFSGSHNANRA